MFTEIYLDRFFRDPDRLQADLNAHVNEFNADKSDIELAREEAQSQNTTLHELFRDWLRGLAGRKRRAQEYGALMDELRHVDAGRKFTREEMNDRR